MSEGYGGGRPSAVYLPLWYYLGGENVIGDGTNQAAIIPAAATIIEIDAEGGDVYYTINGAGENAGFVPEDGGRIIGPLVNLNTLVFNIAAGTTAHVMYFRENTKRV